MFKFNGPVDRSRHYPPLPSPILGEASGISQGTKLTTRSVNLDTIGTSGTIQRPDLRQASQMAPEDQIMSTSSGNQGQGGYHPTHGGYFEGPPPPAPVSLYTGRGSPLVGQWRQFVQNQPVEVNIQGQGWVVGAVVAVVHAMQAFGSTVKVRFRRPQYRHDEEQSFPNEPGYIRPRQNPSH